mmetsp:Transcript_30475/g.85308  ORF Transcript_30475/g.85308 Transcript_30475/m.85308 type:complete len:217 (+) Transcript_30475:540-1190(+)
MSRPDMPPYVVYPSVRMSVTLHCSASSSSLRASQPPLLERPSFLALIVMPWQHLAISRTMSSMRHSRNSGSRCWMKKAFSANRQASRKSGLPPYLSHSARTARRFPRDTGWPPPLLLVTVTMTQGTRRPSSLRSSSRRCRSRSPLKGASASAPSQHAGDGRSTAAAPVASMLARVVSKCVLLGTSQPPGGARRGSHTAPKRIFSAARPWCVGNRCL